MCLSGKFTCHGYHSNFNQVSFERDFTDFLETETLIESPRI